MLVLLLVSYFNLTSLSRRRQERNNTMNRLVTSNHNIITRVRFS